MTKENPNIELIRILNENIKNPFIAISAEGNVLAFNRQAGKLFEIKENSGNIFDYLDEDSSFELGRLIEDVLSGKKSLVKNIILTFRNTSDLKCQATISAYDQNLIFCTFKPEEHNLRINEITRIKIRKEEISVLIGNKNIEKIIDSIKELFPFTVLGKEKIRRDIDALEELFWIKNNEGIFILVNKKISQVLGINNTQLEGRSEQELLPGYLHEVYASLENYIRDSRNVILLEGIPIHGVSAVNNYQTIEIPLTDSEGNLAAVIGISQKAQKDSKIYSIEPHENLLESVPASVAILDDKGIIKHSSKEFCKLFSDEFSDLRNLQYTNVFPLEISEKVKKFLDSLTEEDEFKVRLSKAGKWKDRELSVQIRRKSGENDQTGLVSVFFEDISPDTDLEKIINKRGKMYEVLIQNNPEPIFIYDKENLHFIEVNQAALNLYGYRRDEFLQMDLTDLYAPEDIQTLLDSSSGSIKEGVFTGPYRHKKKDGKSIFVEISKTSFMFNNRDAFFNVIRDVTDNLEIRKQIQLFKAAFDNTPHFIFITDSSGFVNSVNSIVLDKLGYADTELINSSFASFVKDEDRGLVNSKVFHSRSSSIVSFNTLLKKADGEMLKVEINACPVLNYKNETEAYVLVIKPDIKIPEKGEQKVKEIIVEKIVEKEAPPSDKIDPVFLSGIFHEILTPINAMLGFVQELSDSIEQTTPEQKEAKEIIDQNRRRLLSTMNSVVEYSRMEQESPGIDLKNCSITEIVDDTQEEISDILKNKGIEFAYGKISSSLNFKTDSQKFVSLITLLFKIASQFTSTKKIYFSAYQLDDKNFVISIQDNYTSMSPAFSESFNNIFNKRDIQKDYGVSKLSVKLARSLMDLLQGRFVDQSKKMSGFIFPVEPVIQEPESETEPVIGEKTEKTEKITLIEKEPSADNIEEILPEEPSEVEYEEPEPEVEPKMEEEPNEEITLQYSQAEKRITGTASNQKEAFNKSKIDLSQLSCLYIEDQVDSQILFKVQLKDLNEIKFAVSFEEALPLLDSHNFDFIVLDINLQGEYNGLDALKIIHRMSGYETIPIIAVTAYVLPGDREKFIAAGFNDFISKPIFREKMVESLEKIFQFTHS